MKFLCDVHIAIALVKFLASLGAEAVHVNNVLDGDHTKDNDICEFADKGNYIVITKDVDFRNSYLLNRTPKRLIRICLGNLSNQELIKIFEKNYSTISKYFSQSNGYIEIDRESVKVIED